MGKKRIIKKFEQLSEEIIDLIRQEFPDGFEDHLITFNNPKGEIELALPFETEDIAYLIKMPKDHIPSEDDDSDSGNLGAYDNFENLEIAEDVAEEEEEE